MVEVSLIERWENDKPKLRQVNCSLVNVSIPIVDSLLDSNVFTDGIPACGNAHAGTGVPRVIFRDRIECIIPSNPLPQIINSNTHLLNDRVLISAGHFMPVKRSLGSVNRSSYSSLCEGLMLLTNLRSQGRTADILITINDVTINPKDELNDNLPTLSKDQRKTYYRNFCLPDAYIAEIEKAMNECSTNFKVFVIGENQLSERLKRESYRLVREGLLLQNRQNYNLPTNINIDEILSVAHGSSEKKSDVFISNEGGVTGRPKCVRACTKLAALPYEMGYTAFVQYLPICARNALEGFLIGSYIFSQRYQMLIPFISIHSNRSCH